MQLLTVYLEKVSVKDFGAGKNDFSVRVWEDKGKTKLKAIFPWYSSNRPDKRNKYLVLNCYRWRIEWI